MIRWLIAVLCLALSGIAAAADTPLPIAAQQVREAAEQAARTARERIAAERTTLSRELTALAQEIEAARSAAIAAERTATQTKESLIAAQREHTDAQTRQHDRIERLGRQLGLPPGTVSPVVAVAMIRAAESATQRIVPMVIDQAIHDRGGHPVTVPVFRLDETRRFALGSDHGTRGALVQRDGVWLVRGPALPRSIDATSIPRTIPLDVTGSWAIRTTAAGRTFADWLAAGRIFIWPILAVGVLGLLIALTRAIAVLRAPIDRPALNRALAAIAQRSAATLIPGPLQRIVAAGTAGFGQPRAAREALLDQAVLREGPALARGLSLLLLFASIAPLLGLLGTVTGMIDLFAVIGQQGSGNAKSLTGGISEALITTQAGMLVAVPLLVAHALLNRLVERRLHVLEEAACALLAIEDPAAGEAP